MKKLLAMLMTLCILCGVGFAEEKVERSVPEAKAEDLVGRVKVGKFSFELPEGVVENEDFRLVEDGTEIVVCDAEEGYRLFLCSIDYKQLGIPLDDIEISDVALGLDYFHFCVALGIFRGKNSDDEISEMLDEVKSLKAPLEKYGESYLAILENSEFTITHYYNGAGFAIVGSWLTTDAKESAFYASAEIAQSFWFHGVSEEQMAADAEAVRIEEDAAQQYIVITNSSANIRSGPGSEYGKVTTASKGDTFPMLGKEDTWYKIEVSGQIGYVAQGLCKIKE